MFTHSGGKWRADGAKTSALILISIFILGALGCGSGLPSVPTDPDDILGKADRYYHRKRYFQSGELYKAFVQRFPGHERSDYAQFMLAESYFGDEEWSLAAVEYRILIGNYGYSDYVDDAVLREAVSLFKQAPKAVLDQSMSKEAQDRLKQFLRAFPDSPLMPEVQELMVEVNTKLAEKEMRTAYFYFKQKKYMSALIYLDAVIDNYPNTEHWIQAVYMKAEIHYIRGELEEARKYYQQVLDYGDSNVKNKASSGLQRVEKEIREQG